MLDANGEKWRLQAGGVPMHCSNVAVATLEQCIGMPPANANSWFYPPGCLYRSDFTVDSIDAIYIIYSINWIDCEAEVKNYMWRWWSGIIQILRNDVTLKAKDTYT